MATCGGTIISEKYILTAAHCLIDKQGSLAQPDAFGIGVGHTNVYNQTMVKAKSIIVHPDFIGKDTDGLADIGILEIDPLTFGGLVDKIPIFTGNIPAGQNFLAAGWGVTENGEPDFEALRGVLVMSGDASACKKFMPSFEDNNGPQICLPESLTPGKMTGSGDSGTGLFVYNNGVVKLAGLDSVATQVVYPGNNTVATVHLNVHVDYYMDFITNTTGLTEAYLSGSSDAVST
ncbi:hypothetical protein LPJ57_003502 [Coemansia sp. RSA 486]|nr:hypothetical protein LPJ57_003502 [Coemansia sp. RSA 486]KAJ2235522.1 hypothetical protein IWW45_002539 [Coemansia sp. RSA 485]